jgi:restriction system protein
MSNSHVLSALVSFLILCAGPAFGQAPDLSGFSVAEQAQMRHACDVRLRLYGPARYYSCLQSQVAELRKAQAPDLNEFSAAEQAQMRHACDVKLRLYGPAQYYSCLQSQVTALRRFMAPEVVATPHRSTESSPPIAGASAEIESATPQPSRSLSRKRKASPAPSEPPPAAKAPQVFQPVAPARFVSPASEPTRPPVASPSTKSAESLWAGFTLVALVGLTCLIWFAAQRCTGCNGKTLNRSGLCDPCARLARLRAQAREAERRAEDEQRRKEAEAEAARERRRDAEAREAEHRRQGEERRRQEEERRRKATETLEELQSLSGVEFEKLVRSLFERDGYRVVACGGSGDEGIDLILHLDRAKDVVQCKRWKSDIGSPVIREFYGSMIHAGARHGFIITTASFSSSATSFAAGKPILLIDGAYLLGWVHGRRSSRKDGDSSRSTSAVNDPYAVLEINRGASHDEIRAAYRSKIAQYHPDKVAHLAPEYQEIARVKSQQINDAYRTLSRER